MVCHRNCYSTGEPTLTSCRSATSPPPPPNRTVATSILSSRTECLRISLPGQLYARQPESDTENISVRIILDTENTLTVNCEATDLRGGTLAAILPPSPPRGVNVLLIQEELPNGRCPSERCWYPAESRWRSPAVSLSTPCPDPEKSWCRWCPIV